MNKNIQNIIIHYYGKAGIDIGEKTANDICCVLTNPAGFNKEFIRYPEKVIKDFINITFDGELMYYPCFMIELREILANKVIFSRKNITFFPLEITSVSSVSFSSTSLYFIPVNSSKL